MLPVLRLAENGTILALIVNIATSFDNGTALQGFGNWQRCCQTSDRICLRLWSLRRLGSRRGLSGMAEAMPFPGFWRVLFAGLPWYVEYC